MLLNYTYKVTYNLVVPEEDLYLMLFVNSGYISPILHPVFRRRRPARADSSLVASLPSLSLLT